MEKLRLLGAVCTCVLVLMTTTTNAAVLPLQGRLPATPGGADYQAYYDPNLDITWAADANINGEMDWFAAQTWLGGLTIGGLSGWRLPSADVNGDNTVVSCSGGGVVGCADNEMGYLYWEEGITPSTPGPFSNVQSGGYWSGTEHVSSSIFAWYFNFYNGSQVAINKTFSFNVAWAVRTGDVPLPAVIDIKPGNSKNPVNPRSKGKLKVAVLTTDGLDASTVDASTVQFGPGTAEPVWYRLDDVDYDGDWDLVFKFNTQETGISCGDTEATLTGETIAGQSFSGMDSIKTVGCNPKKHHDKKYHKMHHNKHNDDDHKKR